MYKNTQINIGKEHNRKDCRLSTIDDLEQNKLFCRKNIAQKTRHVVNATVTITELWRRRLECKIGSNYTIEEASDTNPRKIVLGQDTEKHARILRTEDVQISSIDGAPQTKDASDRQSYGIRNVLARVYKALGLRRCGGDTVGQCGSPLS